MNCPGCNSTVATKRNRCERCGEDLTTYKKMFMLSNKYYNEALEKSKVRDLSGAIFILKKSLEINKNNTNARNLLGLVYYEMGETVSALSEWVISKHLQDENNDADDYMQAVQSNPTKLDNLNQTIKKYNAALLSTKQGNDDLAIIQLKKVTSLNPHFVKALQLLALLYMKNGEQDKAQKCLVRASKIDVSNTTTLRYLHELGEISGTVREDNKENNKDSIKSTSVPLFSSNTYKEDKPNIWAFVNLILGVVIGIAVLFFLIVPTVKSDLRTQYKKLEVKYNEELNKNTQASSSVEKENKALQEEIDQLQTQIDGFEVVEYDDTIYDELFKAIQLYLTELAKPNESERDNTIVAEAISKVDAKVLEKPDAISLYEQIKEATYVKSAEILYDEGHTLYSDRKYDEALTILKKAYEYDSENINSIYFIGRTYHQLTDYENAAIYYNILVDDFPDTERAEEAKGQLVNIGQ